MPTSSPNLPDLDDEGLNREWDAATEFLNEGKVGASAWLDAIEQELMRRAFKIPGPTNYFRTKLA